MSRNFKFEEFETKLYYVVVYKSQSIWHIRRKADDFTTAWFVYSEGMETYKELKRCFNKAVHFFNRKCSHYIFTKDQEVINLLVIIAILLGILVFLKIADLTQGVTLVLKPLIRCTAPNVFDGLELDTQTGTEFTIVTNCSLVGVLETILERYKYDKTQIQRQI